MTEGWKTAFKTACRKAGLEGLWFHDLRHIFVTRKVREGWDYKRLMASNGHETFAVFQRYNNPAAEDLQEVVLAPAPAFVYKNGTVTFPQSAHLTEKVTDAVA